MAAGLIGGLTAEEKEERKRTSYVVILGSMCGLMVAILLKGQICNWPSYCGVEFLM